MNLLNDPRNRGITTLVCFHDLLGFGDMLASSGGSLDSAVGEIAYRRIVGLQRSITDVKDSFPPGTRFFHFNDTVAAYLDVPNVLIQSAHTDAGIAAMPPSRDDYLTVLHFMGAAAQLHQVSIQREENERIGPAGRTFVVLGKRWHLLSLQVPDVIDVPELEANLAFSEAYIADASGSRSGFNHSNLSRMYINDLLQLLLFLASVSLHKDEIGWLHAISHGDDKFPQNIYSNPNQAIIVDTFHRKREYFSVLAHYVAKIPRALDRAKQHPSSETGQ
jgi:hypothetical protein